jgi:putative membrane protein
MQKLIAGAICAAALIAAGSASAQAAPQAYRYNWTPAGTLTPAPSPMDFLMLAGGGDQYEIQSSQAVLETTQNPELRRFAQMMIDHHTKTSADAMAAARRDGVTPPPAMPAQHQAAMINALRMFQGVERDRLYLTQQQMAHKEALGVHKTYSEAGTSPALKAAATATVPIVQRHLAEVDRMIAAAR